MNFDYTYFMLVQVKVSVQRLPETTAHPPRVLRHSHTSVTACVVRFAARGQSAITSQRAQQCFDCLVVVCCFKCKYLQFYSIIICLELGMLLHYAIIVIVKTCGYCPWVKILSPKQFLIGSQRMNSYVSCGSSGVNEVKN